MLVEALALGATAILKQFLGKTGEGFAKRVGETTADGVGRLYQSIKNKFQPDKDATEMLECLEEDPTSTARVVALEGILKEKLLRDESFKNEIDQLVHDIATSDIHNQLAIGEQNLVVGRDANGVFVTGDGNQIVKP